MRARVVAVVAGESTVGVARDEQVMDLAEALIGQLGAGDALGAVTGPGEGHEQRGNVLGEAVAGGSHDVSRRDGIHPCVESATQAGRQHLAREG